MRLIDTRTGRFQWFEDPRQVRYAILSHVWSKDGEQSFRDVQNLIDAVAAGSSILDDPSGSLSDKIKSFCRVALEHGFDFGWVDSCCIDKTSSSELSEAITSMYDWYRHADMCFAYLHDVDSKKADTVKRTQQFCDSKWFLRGWTLQELLAPSILLFLSSSWDIIGSKQTSASLIAGITKIDSDVLTFKRSLDEVTVACRMSWAASRRTTREEDEAYCLMGIFGVSFPIIYGEGRHAFVRLQEEIIRTIPDQTIFAWGRIISHQHPFTFERPNGSAIESIPNPHPTIQHPSVSNQYLLASSPRDYRDSSHIIPLSRDEFAQRVSMPPHSTYQVFTVTAHGIHVRLPLIAIAAEDRHETFPTHLALLACETQDQGHLLALLLRPQLGNAGSGFSVGAVVVNQSVTQAGFLDLGDLKEWHYRAVFLSLQDIHQSLRRNFIEIANLYLPHRPLRGVRGTEGDHRIVRRLGDLQDNFEVQLSGWSRTLLSLDESRLIEDGDDPIMPQSRRLSPHLAPWLVIAYKGLGGVHINIQIGRCECPLGRHSGTALLGVLVWSPQASSSLEKRFEEESHRLNHPVHLHSWAYRDGVASTDVELRPFSSPRENIVVHLTLSSDQAAPNAYRLGVEVTSREAEVESANPQARMRDRGRSATTHDIAFPSSQGGGPRADAASYTLPDRLPVRDRVQSQTFSASPFNDAWILPSPPLTAANSKSSNHTSNGWSTHFSRSDHAALAQGDPKPSLRRSSSWDVQPTLAESQAFLLSSTEHSFEGEVSRAQTPHDEADEFSIRDRNESIVGDGRAVSQQSTQSHSPAPTSGEVQASSISAAAKTLNPPSGGLKELKGDSATTDLCTQHNIDPHSRPVAGSATGALPSPLDNANATKNEAAPDSHVTLESPYDMGGGGSSPKALWAGGEDLPPRRDAHQIQSKVSPLPQRTAVEGRGEMNQQSQSPQVPVDAHPSAECTSSYHLPLSGAGRSPSALAGEEVWTIAAGRDGGRENDDDSAHAPPLISQAPNTAHMGNEATQPDTAAPAKRAEGHGERRQSGDGTHKDTKRRSGSGFIMRGIRFFKRAGSSS